MYKIREGIVRRAGGRRDADAAELKTTRSLRRLPRVFPQVNVNLELPFEEECVCTVVIVAKRHQRGGQGG